MKQFIAFLFIVICSILMLVSTYFMFTLGWGMEVKSWGWLVGLWFVNLIIGFLIQLAAIVLKDED